MDLDHWNRMAPSLACMLSVPFPRSQMLGFKIEFILRRVMLAASEYTEQLPRLIFTRYRDPVGWLVFPVGMI